MVSADSIFIEIYISEYLALIEIKLKQREELKNDLKYTFFSNFFLFKKIFRELIKA